MPHLQRTGDKEITPTKRGCDEESHSTLDNAAWIEPVRQRAGRHRKHQVWQPMRYHRKAGESRGMKFLEQHPVADDVFDIVGHHRQHVGHKLSLKATIT
jgi:hypothetical protein